MSSATPSLAAPGKYLTVIVAEEAYGIPVRQVREIIRLQKITPMPQAPDFIKGVINLRGRVVPVIDLRTRFGLPSNYGDRTCIVVVQIAVGRDTPIALGLIVDSVEDVANVDAADIEPPPEFGVRIDTDYLLGIAKVRDKVKTLLDIDRVVTGDVIPLASSR